MRVRKGDAPTASPSLFHPMSIQDSEQYCDNICIFVTESIHVLNRQSMMYHILHEGADNDQHSIFTHIDDQYAVRVDSFKSNEEAEAKLNYYHGGDGLTKLERFTLAAMQGLSSDPDITPDDVAKQAVRIAQKTLNHLKNIEVNEVT